MNALQIYIINLNCGSRFCYLYCVINVLVQL